MSLKLHSHLQTLVVRDVIVAVIADYRVCHLQVAGEHLVKVSYLSLVSVSHLIAVAKLYRVRASHTTAMWLLKSPQIMIGA